MIQARQQLWEAKAATILQRATDEPASIEATSLELEQLACDVIDDWWRLLDEMLLRFGDGYEYDWAIEGDQEDGKKAARPIEYATEWLEKVSEYVPVEEAK